MLARKVKEANSMETDIDYKSSEAFEILIKNNIIRVKEGFKINPRESFEEYEKRLNDFQKNKKGDDMFTLNVTKIGGQADIVNDELNYQIDLYAKRQGGKFTHICPKCKKTSVEYHKPDKQHEKEEIEEKFGFRGERIQSWCRSCRSKERNK